MGRNVRISSSKVLEMPNIINSIFAKLDSHTYRNSTYSRNSRNSNKNPINKVINRNFHNKSMNSNLISTMNKNLNQSKNKLYNNSNSQK
jgi:hypothetical protein